MPRVLNECARLSNPRCGSGAPPIRLQTRRATAPTGTFPLVRGGLGAVVWSARDGALAEGAQRTFTPKVDLTRVGLARFILDVDHRLGNVGHNLAEVRLGLLQAVLQVV